MKEGSTTEKGIEHISERSKDRRSERDTAMTTRPEHATMERSNFESPAKCV